VDDVLSNYENAITAEKIKIDVDVKPQTVWANRSQFLQLIQNLVGNAIKFRKTEGA
jgi:signal transduction histidine kinase